jgi:hypothetical protein
MRWSLSVAAVVAAVVLMDPGPAAVSALTAPSAAPAPTDSTIYIVYYWRARPGKAAEYADYIRTVAEPIDAEARRAGVFEDVHTYTQAITTGAPGADWTHMRVFRLRNFAALDGFSAGLDAAGRRVVPDSAQRQQNAAHAAELRDLVRQEIWRPF